MITFQSRFEKLRYVHRLTRLPRVVVCAILVASCTTLQPVQLSPEYTAPPAESSLWDAVDAAAVQDWHALLNDGPSALDWRLHAIDSASESIDFQTFLWHFDTTGSLVLNHIIRAADRGVAVRVLVDDTFLVHEDKLLLAIAEHQNIEYRVYNPFKRRRGGPATRELLNVAEFGRLDHRMHNKSMVIDNRVAIVGGRNIADEYFGLDAGANFRDLEVILGGMIVQEISAAFDDYWNNRWSVPIATISHKKASPEQLAEARHIADSSGHLHEEEDATRRAARWLALVADADVGKTTLIVDDPPMDNPSATQDAPVKVANELINLFDGATDEILIVSAYLIPTPDLEGAIIRALDRGVRVRILTNSIRSNNHLVAHSAYRTHISTLLEQGAEMHEVRVDANDRAKYMLTPIGRKQLALHAKALVIDADKVFIGSANLDPRSLRINTEMGMIISSQLFNEKVRQSLEGDFSQDNAWQLELQEDGSVFWVSGDQTLDAQPAESFMQRIEDWFFSHVPLEGEL